MLGKLGLMRRRRVGLCMYVERGVGWGGVWEGGEGMEGMEGMERGGGMRGNKREMKWRGNEGYEGYMEFT